MAEALLVWLFFLLNFLRVNSYSFLRPESAMLLLLFFAPTAMFGWLCRKAGRPWIFYGLLLAVIEDLSFGVFCFGQNPWRRVIAAGIVTLLFLIAFLAKNKIRPLLRLVLTVSLISTFFLSIFIPERLFVSRTKNAASEKIQNKPNIYFFILDEHIGMAGWPDYPQTVGLGKEISDYYLKEGFSVYPKAYSNFCATLDSIPSIINSEIPVLARTQIQGKKIKKSRLFEKWREGGYQIRVYQSSHLDYSSPEGVVTDKSFTYKETSSGFVANTSLSVFEKFWVLLNNFIEGSSSVILKKAFSHFLPNHDSVGMYMTGALAADPVIQELEKDVAANPRGTAFFVHFLIPHSSYIFNSQGSVISPFLWESAYGEDLESVEGKLNSPESRHKKYLMYGGQVRYTHKLMDNFFSFLKQKGLFQESIIFIMSDHGSRIFTTNPEEKNKKFLTQDDLRDAYAAFLVTKNGNQTSSLHPERIPTISEAANFFGLPLIRPEEYKKRFYQTAKNTPPREAGGSNAF